jgi:hypothetical protein
MRDDAKGEVEFTLELALEVNEVGKDEDGGESVAEALNLTVEAKLRACKNTGEDRNGIDLTENCESEKNCGLMKESLLDCEGRSGYTLDDEERFGNKNN